MRVGIDSYTMHQLRIGRSERLAFVREHGLDGMQLESSTAISPTLDEGALREYRQEVERLGLYLDLGVPAVNPHHFKRPSPYNQEIARLGGGDYVKGLERHIRAARAAGCTELRSILGNDADRLRSSVPYSQQLHDSTEFLRGLRPMLLDLGCRINIENHGDVTTFEMVRLVEDVGSDVLGILLDTANVFCNVEDPMAAARRAAPYVHKTHAKDAIVFFGEQGLLRQVRPAGQGAVPWETILPILGEYSRDLTLSIEDHKGIYGVPIFDPAFLGHLPDLTPTELARLVQTARTWDGRIARGETVHPDRSEAIPWAEEGLARVDSARAYLKQLLAKVGLAA